MIGDMRTDLVILDYRKVATPLTPDLILEDIHELRENMHNCGGPLPPVLTEIAMWDHQWRWLIHIIGSRLSSQKSHFTLSVEWSGGGRNEIWGVPVRVVKP